MPPVACYCPFQGGHFGVFYLMLVGICVSCGYSYSIVSYLYVSCSGTITSVGEERANFLLSFTCNYVISVRRVSSSFWCLG